MMKKMKHVVGGRGPTAAGRLYWHLYYPTAALIAVGVLGYWFNKWADARFYIPSIDPGDGEDLARNYESMLNCARRSPPSRRDEPIELGNYALGGLEERI